MLDKLARQENSPYGIFGSSTELVRDHTNARGSAQSGLTSVQMLAGTSVLTSAPMLALTLVTMWVLTSVRTSARALAHTVSAVWHACKLNTVKPNPGCKCIRYRGYSHTNFGENCGQPSVILLLISFIDLAAYSSFVTAVSDI